MIVDVIVKDLLEIAKKMDLVLEFFAYNDTDNQPSSWIGKVKEYNEDNIEIIVRCDDKDRIAIVSWDMVGVISEYVEIADPCEECGICKEGNEYV